MKKTVSGDFAGIRALPREIWALFAIRLINSAGNFVFPFLTLILTQRVGWTPGKAGVFLSVVQLAGLPGLMLGGKLGDLWGRKRIIMGCQVIAVTAFVVCTIAGFTPWVPYVIAIASIALSMTWPLSGAMVADLVPPEGRKSAYALVYWGNNIGFSVGPLVAGFLFNRAPGLMFLGNAGALTAAILILRFLVPETLPRTEKPAAITETAAGESSAEPSGEKAQTSGTLAVFFSRPLLVGFTLVMALMNFVYAQHIFSLPLFLNDRLGSSGSELFGTAMTVNGLTVVLFTLPLTRLTGRLPPLVSVAIAALLYAAGFGLLSFGGGPILVLVSTMIWTWGEILASTNINVFIASHTPMSHRGRINSVTALVGNIGSLLAPLAAGAYIVKFGSAAVWPATAVLGVTAALLMFLLSGVERAAGPGALKSK